MKILSPGFLKTIATGKVIPQRVMARIKRGAIYGALMPMQAWAPNGLCFEVVGVIE